MGKIGIGIIVVIVGLVIATVILGMPGRSKKSLIETIGITIGIIIVMFVWFWIVSEFLDVFAALLLLPSAVWIYLVFMVWKKKTKIFHDQMEPKLAERRYKRLKTFLLVAGISFAMHWVTVFVGDVLNLNPEGVAYFLITFFSVVLFVIATIGSLFIFLKGRLKAT
ncbi:hypothetical protein ACFLXU_01285 [Chloroflexota bacterium]